MNSLAPTFIAEARDILVQLEDSLLALDKAADDPDLVNAVFRALHTLKGSGAVAGFAELERFAHRVESVVDEIRSGQRVLDQALTSTILACIDHIKALVEASDARPAALVPRSDALIAALSTADRLPAATWTRAWWVRATVHARLLGTVEPASELARLGDRGPAVWRGRLTRAIAPLDTLDPAALPLELIALWLGETVPPDALGALRAWSDVDVTELAPEVDPEALDPSSPELIAALVDGDRDAAAALFGAAASPDMPRLAVAPPGASPEAVEETAPEPSRVSAAAEPTFRVKAAKLDDLVDLVGELVIVQNRLDNIAHRLGDTELTAAIETVERACHRLRDSAMDLRMMPVDAAFSRMKRVVRDVSVKLGKAARLEIRGGATQLDKHVIDRLHEPLIHLVRNALDHGLETPAERREAGKEPEGTLTLSATHEDAHAVLEVKDDGRGLDAAVIRTRAIERGLIREDEELSDPELFHLIFEPGFSTAASVSSVSGRGVGMDAVRSVVRSLRGDIEMSSAPGDGTTVRITIPLTLAIIEGLLVQLSDTPCVFPLAQIEECIELSGDQRHATLVELRGEAVPCLDLASWFGLEASDVKHRRLVVTRVSGRRTGFLVDRVDGLQQTVVKSLGRAYDDVAYEGIAGASILGGGEVALVLDPQALSELRATGDAHARTTGP